MIITRMSPLSGKVNTMDLPITQADMDRCWSLNPKGTEHIQQVFPQLTPSQREFLKTGITEEEWNEMFGDGDD